jgi:hypothetical protein
MPNTSAAGRVLGQGPYVLLTCKSGGARTALLFLTEMERTRVLAKWDAIGGHCGQSDCNGDHVLLKLECPLDPEISKTNSFVSPVMAAGR